MECPKCGLEIDDNTIVCPNCKKVLKVVCPICKTINEGNTCKKCGYVIVTKCHNCGKINPTANLKCKKCNFSLEKSVILNESNTDDFVMLTIDFPNLSEMKTLLGSAKLFNKFKVNLDKIIADYVKSIGIRRQIIDKTYVIRFNKDYTFNSSVNTAVNAAIEILNLITTLNCKLTKKNNSSVRCNMCLLKRNVENNPNDYQSGFNINMVYEKGKDKEKRLLNSFQVITDAALFESLEKNYKLSPLNSVMVNGEMTMFYELDIKDLIVIDPSLFAEDEDDDEIKIPNFVQNMLIEQDKVDGDALQKAETPNDPDAIYDLETINFDEINCEFIRTENVDVFYHIVNKLQSVPLGILSIKTAPMYVPYSLKIINEIEELGIYNNIISITCYDEMKYSPYAFFRNLVSAIFEYTVSQQLFGQNDFSAFASIDPENMIRDLVTLSEREIQNAIDTRNEYFDIFLTLLKVIPNTLIFIENFDKIDSSSYDVLKYLFEAFEELQISYLITHDKDFSLHKQSHFLLSRPYYTEITLKPTPFERIIAENKNFYRNIMNDFYFHRIAKYSCGSILFLDIAIQYLVESGVYEFTEDSIEMVNPKTIIIPSNLNRLLRRRLNLLKDDPQAMRFLATVLLLGTRIDVSTIESLGYENTEQIIDKLSDMGYVYFYNNCMYFPNYNLLRDNLLEVMNKIDLQKIANELFSKVFVENMPSPVKSYLYTLLSDESNAFLEWEKLAKVNLSLGDFSSYLNCSTEILKLLEKRASIDSTDEDVEAYKLNLYKNISDNLYQYVPEKTQDIAELTLKNLEKTTDIDKIIQLCNKMIHGALISSQYTHALCLTHKVLSLIPNASIDPNAPNFNLYFLFMSLVHVEILFNIGAMEDCLDVGYKVLNVISNENIDSLRPEHMTDIQFKDMVKGCVGYIALANVIQMKGNVTDFLTIAYASLDFIPKSYDIFIQLQELIAGREVVLSEDMKGDDKFSNVVYNIINAFVNFKDNPEQFAEEVYHAKLNARNNNLTQIEIFCDLLIGYTYVKLDAYQKASSILYKIIKSVKNQGMFLLQYLGWYFLSEMNLKQKKNDIAYGMLNNSIIQLEKYGKASDFVMMLFKYNMFKVMMFRGDIEKAQICLNQAFYITQKYGLKFEFDVNPEHYMQPVVQDEVPDVQQEETEERPITESEE